MLLIHSSPQLSNELAYRGLGENDTRIRQALGGAQVIYVALNFERFDQVRIRLAFGDAP